ncbi:hypothetical protein HYS28_01050 [Candidatus Uhrbacteria bacterium]|nr:hypothetical protein [Candidatus Uhrbacteria bacterium]
MRNTTTIAATVVLALLVTGLLVKNRLDTAPHTQDITLITTFCTTEETADACWQDTEAPAHELRSSEYVYREYLVGDTRFLLDTNTLLSQDGERFRFDTGRVVIDGDATLTVRDVMIAVDGAATLVHYSWLNKVDVKVLRGTAYVTQGTYTADVRAGNAISIDTLPPYDAIAPTTFNTDAVPFYDWALE